MAKVALGLALLSILLSAVLQAEDAPLPSKGDFLGRTLHEILGEDNVKAVAAKTSDSEALLGLAILSRAPAGSRAAAAACEYDKQAELVWILVNPEHAVHGITAGLASRFVQLDPSNAVGYYLEADACLQAGNVLEMIVTLKRATACPGIDIYQDEYIRAVLKALDALELKGPERLVAACEARMRPWHFLLDFPQRVRAGIAKLPPEERDIVADQLLGLAGQLEGLSGKSPSAKVAQYRALIEAFRIKEAIAAEEKSPRDQAYRTTAAVLDAGDWGEAELRESQVAEWAFVLVMMNKTRVEELLQLAEGIPPEAMEQLEKALQEKQCAVDGFLAMASGDADAVISDILTAGPGGISRNRPQLMGAARELDEKTDALERIAEDVVKPYATSNRLKLLGMTLAMYAGDRAGAFPPDLETLVREGYLKGALPVSPLSGKPYVYLAPRDSITDSDQRGLVLVYDEGVLGSGEHPALYNDMLVGSVTVEKLASQEKQRRK